MVLVAVLHQDVVIVTSEGDEALPPIAIMVGTSSGEGAAGDLSQLALVVTVALRLLLVVARVLTPRRVQPASVDGVADAVMALTLA